MKVNKIKNILTFVYLIRFMVEFAGIIFYLVFFGRSVLKLESFANKQVNTFIYVCNLGIYLVST